MSENIISNNDSLINADQQSFESKADHPSADADSSSEIEAKLKVSEREAKTTLRDRAPSRVGLAYGQLRILLINVIARLVAVLRLYYRRCHVMLKKSGMISKIKRHKPLFFTLVGVVALFIVVLVLFVSVGHKRVHHGPNAVSNLMRINNMQDSLGKIQSNLTVTSQMTQEERQSVENKLQEIDAKLGQISRSTGASRGQQIKALRATLQSNSVNLSQKISALNHEIKAIKSKVFPAPTLSARALPFSVVAIEPWNGKPYVEIRQKQNKAMVDYVGLYGVRGGWKVIDLNAPEQTATFLNQGGQIVHVVVSFQEHGEG